MTKKAINSTLEKFQKLSIQVSLNGLSFCIWDTIRNTVLASENIVFEKELTPYRAQKELTSIFSKYDVADMNFSDVTVIHRNNLFSLVPKSLFDKEELANYIKFNAKILADDHLAYDEIEGCEIMNVYVPFMNINNYMYELFGEFVFKHSGTVMIESLLNDNAGEKNPICYAHVSEEQMELIVISSKKLLFYNSFYFVTKEDFMYYLLFTLEQLQLDTETILLKLFGAVKKEDDLYNLSYQYIKNVSLFTPTMSTTHLMIGEAERETIDFTVLSSL